MSRGIAEYQPDRLPVTLDSLLLLKQHYGVSVAAIIMRLRALNLISDED
ncbi:hypothetical protein LVQ79_06855 [Buttiauxella sp. A2-C1_F]|nr:hypothetical protein [Buttiauxella sp. A2-C1_F]MCE0845271.1 hypothetical protein [Buttiauxella sp. A2-C1_F]